jgi:hypothetical protein
VGALFQDETQGLKSRAGTIRKNTKLLGQHRREVRMDLRTHTDDHGQISKLKVQNFQAFPR